MASHPDFVAYVCEQLAGAGEISYKKMFGEYGVYCDNKLVGVICGNQFYVKKTAEGAAVYENCAEGPPYAGAKPHFIVERLEDRGFLAAFLRATCDALPAPAPKKKKRTAKTDSA